MDGAFDKMFCCINNPAFPLLLLPPYESVSKDRFDRYRVRLSTQYPNWLP